MPTLMDSFLLYDLLNYAHYRVKTIHRAKQLVEEWLELDPTSEMARNNRMNYDVMIANQEAVDSPAEATAPDLSLHLPKPKPDTQTFINYEALCRGEEVDTVHRPPRHQLYCSYKHYHPIFVLIPLKEEVLNFDPPVTVFHDILTEREMAKVRELATPRLERSMVLQSKTENRMTAKRISKSAWIQDHEHALIRRISAKSGAVANLTTDTVEDLQVVNYGIGGFYVPHMDFRREEEMADFMVTGNRIATVIFYVDDVEAGGSTVFPDIGVAVRPEKGACAVWYNLKRSGAGDERTMHAGCPVLTGMKWIATKWFREYGNEFLRKCALNRYL